MRFSAILEKHFSDVAVEILGNLRITITQFLNGLVFMVDGKKLSMPCYTDDMPRPLCPPMNVTVGVGNFPGKGRPLTSTISFLRIPADRFKNRFSCRKRSGQYQELGGPGH